VVVHDRAHLNAAMKKLALGSPFAAKRMKVIRSSVINLADESLTMLDSLRSGF
jgi:hypothetical protein